MTRNVKLHKNVEKTTKLIESWAKSQKCMGREQKVINKCKTVTKFENLIESGTKFAKLNKIKIKNEKNYNK